MENFKSLGLISKKKNASTSLLNKDGKIQFEHRGNANISKKFYSKLTIDQVKKSFMQVINFIVVPLKIIMLIYLTIKKIEFQLFNVSEDVVRKVLSYLNTSGAAGMDKTSKNF